MRKIIDWFLCLNGLHDWNCAAKQGIKPTPAQLADGVDGFYDYATMYCARCKKISRLNKEPRR